MAMQEDEGLKSPRRSSSIDYLLTQVGELKGTTQAIVTQLQSLSLDLSRIAQENDRKHTENIRTLESYKTETRVELNRVNRLIYTAAGALAAIELLIQFYIQWSK
jgi:hypothetical protein